MMSLNNLLFMTMMLGPLTALSLFHNRLLLSLLNLELIVLSMVLTCVLLEAYMSSLDSLTAMFILTMGASEASVGLSCLVMITRSNSSDNMMSMLLTSY